MHSTVLYKEYRSKPASFRKENSEDKPKIVQYVAVYLQGLWELLYSSEFNVEKISKL